MNTTTTTYTDINKHATFNYQWRIGDTEVFQYTVATIKAADYNAEFEIPEYYMWDLEAVVDGREYTFYKSTLDNDELAVKVKDESGVRLSFYTGNTLTTQFWWNIEK